MKEEINYLEETKKLDKIKKCVESSTTIKQLNNSLNMINRYIESTPDNMGLIVMSLIIKEIAIDKKLKIQEVQS